MLYILIAFNRLQQRQLKGSWIILYPLDRVQNLRSGRSNMYRVLIKNLQRKLLKKSIGHHVRVRSPLLFQATASVARSSALGMAPMMASLGKLFTVGTVNGWAGRLAKHVSSRSCSKVCPQATTAGSCYKQRRTSTQHNGPPMNEEVTQLGVLR